MANGCDYMKPTFSVACNSGGTEQRDWDLAFLTEEDFLFKYGHSKTQYKELKGE